MSTQSQQPLTDEEIRAIRERVEKTTKGTWEVQHLANIVAGRRPILVNSFSSNEQEDVVRDENLANVAFAASAHQDVPRLLDEIERLRAIEAQAIEQSEYMQRELLSPSEAEGLKREVERLRAELDRARWIPVTERLPGDDATVLVYCPGVFKYVNGPHRALFGRYSHIQNKWVILSLGANDTWNVTHWMPLPAPPTQEAQED